jgi:hypothetical protein
MPDTWYIAINGAQVGPLTLQELKATLMTFANANDVPVRCDRLADWKPARDLPELRSQTAQSPALPAAPNTRVVGQIRVQLKPITVTDCSDRTSTGLDDIRPIGRIGAVEGTAKQRSGLPITAANVASAIAILAMVVFACAMSKSADPAGGATNRHGVVP